MKHTVLLLTALCLVACSTRSISDPYDRDPNPFYRGELTEFQVLGIDQSAPSSERDLREMSGTQPVRIRRGGTILLIQSGAMIPDAGMQEALDRHFAVVPFSGSPPKAGESYSGRLRAAAVRAGCEAVVCYWGILERARRNLATKSVSWIPIVGSFIPDEKQEMRVRLKVLCLDPRSGAWSAFAPTVDEDTATSMGITRHDSDVGQVERLKGAAYLRAADELLHRFAR